MIVFTRRSVIEWLILTCLVACGGEPPAASGESSGDAMSAGAAIAQQVPDSEVFLARLAWEDGRPVLSEIRNITRRPGYDNQPQFSRDGQQLFFTSIGEDQQADIYRYLIAEQQSAPYAVTAQSEYSPTVMPAGTGISVVRVEDDGTQRLWSFAAANAEARLVLESVTAVGYHAWLDPTTVALFIVDEPPRLVIARVGEESTTDIAANVGRALAWIPGDNALAFIDKQDPDVWRVVRYDLADESFAELIDCPAGSEDFAWTANGGLFMGDGTRLLYWDGHAASGWSEVLDVANTFGGRITRIAVSPGMERLALVIDLAALN